MKSRVKIKNPTLFFLKRKNASTVYFRIDLFGVDLREVCPIRHSRPPTFGLDGERVQFVDHSFGESRAERSALARVRAAFHVHGERRADHGHAVVEDVDGVWA